MIDASSAGLVPFQKIGVGYGSQVPFAEAIRKRADILTGTVGMITNGVQADTVLTTGQADVVFLARGLLRDPYWPRRAANDLNVKLDPPVQYQRGW